MNLDCLFVLYTNLTVFLKSLSIILYKGLKYILKVISKNKTIPNIE